MVSLSNENYSPLVTLCYDSRVVREVYVVDINET